MISMLAALSALLALAGAANSPSINFTPPVQLLRRKLASREVEERREPPARKAPPVSVRRPYHEGIAVLCYHDFQLDPKNEMTNTPSNFEAQMRWLKDHGYRTLSIQDLVEIMKGKEAEPPKSVAITFDDGYEGVYKYAYPVLEKFGFQGTLFLVTSVMGNEAPPMPHLTWPQIEEMDRANVIRAEVHTRAMHIKLGLRLDEEEKAGLPPTDIVRDLQGAKDDIENHTHRTVSYIAWPFGDFNKGLIRLAAKLGYYGMVSTEYGVNYPGGNPLTIKRIRLSSKYDTLQRFEEKMAQYGLH